LAGYRILALDVDGTLLAPDGSLRRSTAEAVHRAARAGIQPLLCTGRRYRRALPVADELGLKVPLVCNSGALVKDPADHRTIWRADLAPSIVFEVLALFKRHDHPAVSFTDQHPSFADFRVTNYPTARADFDEYVALNRSHAEVDPGWIERGGSQPHFHLCAIGPRSEMLRFESQIHAALPNRVRTFVQKSPRYSGTMCEVLSLAASKWSAVLHVAEHWGVAPAEICAVGDDMNDVPMLMGAGLGVAMGHAPAEVLSAADHVTGDHDNDGLGEFINRVLLGNGLA
jgi:Cof subfamily protein (haloacid dehalogenase superfamily)